MKYSFLFTCILLVLGCSQDKDAFNTSQWTAFSESDFLNEVSLTGKVLITDSLGYPTRISLDKKDELLFVITDRLGDSWIRVFNTKTGSFHSSFAKKGQGPGEMVYVSEIQIVEDSSLVLVYSGVQNRIDFYDLTEIVDKSVRSPIKSVELDSLGSLSPKYLGNSLFLDVNDTKAGNVDKRLQVFDPYEHSLYTFGSFPEMDILEENDIYKSDVFMAFLNVNPQRTHYVLAHAYVDMIEIYNNESNLVKRLRGPDYFFPMVKAKELPSGGTMVVPMREAKMGYTIPRVDSTSLYVLFNGKSASHHDYHLNRIFSFDLTGNPQTLYTLDIPIFAFDIDFNKGVIYGLTHEMGIGDSEVGIVSFDLNKNSDASRF